MTRQRLLLPSVRVAMPSNAPPADLFRDPAVLLQLGWAPAQSGAGSIGGHRHPDGRQEESLPCHPDTLRDAALAGRGVRLAESPAGRGAVALSAAVRARQGLRGGWQRTGR